MRKENGFSLIELLIVVVILGTLAAIAIPSLVRARQYSQAGSAIQSLRTITTAEHLYERRHKVYGTLADILTEGTIDSQLSAGSKSEYSFTLTLSGDSKSFNCIATPHKEPTAYDHFFVDETAVIRYNTGAPADVDSTPIPR